MYKLFITVSSKSGNWGHKLKLDRIKEVEMINNKLILIKNEEIWFTFSKKKNKKKKKKKWILAVVNNQKHKEGT